MKIMKKAAFLACLCCTLFSCSNVEKKAGEKLQTAREAFERGDYSEAKMQIDSIKILYPKAFEARREGIGLMQQVELKEQEEKESLKELKGDYSQITWGSQIRSYVFQPYTMVKDHRTGAEVGNVQAVMDGDIDYFINEKLKQRD